MSKGSFTFAQVPIADIPRSSFNRSHTHKTTFDAGYLIPFYVDEALPGDTFHVRASMFARLSTPQVPIMDNLHLDTFFFAVPLRLVWDNFQRFMGEQPNPGDSTDFLVPVLDDSSVAIPAGSPYDYFGVPVGQTGLAPSALFGRAYNLIWNEWFRDENLQNRVTVLKTDGPDPVGNYVLKRRGKRHDYFTSALPWPQKGAGVTLPLGTTAPVIPNAIGVPGIVDSTGNNAGSFRVGAVGQNQTVQYTGTAANQNPLHWMSGVNGSGSAYTGLQADLTNASAATINSLRQAFQIQKLLERDARGGTRYVEILRSHFGVVSPDARLQRPEFLGGGSTPIVVNPVTQTAPTSAVSPQGHLAAYAVGGARGIGFSKSFVEHCIVIGLVMARADLSYQQGLPRMFSRRTRYDFYWPALAHLGEQAILNKEIYAADVAGRNNVFGYQERWAEYRYFPSKITGKFRSDDATPLDYWHLAQRFTSLPVLGSTFIEENPPVSRVVAVTTEPQFIFDSSISIQAARPMPVYSVPGMIDHF